MTTTTEAAIRKTPGVSGGDACIRRTRIAVWMLVGYKKLGLSDPEVPEAYPGLATDDLTAAWAYHAAHPEEIEAALRENDES